MRPSTRFHRHLRLKAIFTPHVIIRLPFRVDILRRRFRLSLLAQHHPVSSRIPQLDPTRGDNRQRSRRRIQRRRDDATTTTTMVRLPARAPRRRRLRCPCREEPPRTRAREGRRREQRRDALDRPPVRESHGAGTTTPVSWFEKRREKKKGQTNKQMTNKQRADDNTTTTQQQGDDDDDDDDERERKGECDRERGICEIHLVLFDCRGVLVTVGYYLSFF